MKTLVSVFIIIVACLTTPLLATISIINSDTVIQDGDFYYGLIEVHDTPPDTTTIDMIGGHISERIDSYDNSTINISGGMMSGALNSYDNSTINISGGDYHGTFEANNESRINMSEGIILGLRGYDQSIINVSDGKMNSLGGFNESIIHVRSGMIITAMFAEDSSTIYLYGYGFNYEPLAGEWDDGQLTGYWMDGTAFSIDLLYETTYDHIVLIPEPSTLLLLGLGTVMFRRKK